MELSNDIVNLLATHGAAVFPTGSRHICDPAPTDTDEDYLTLLPSAESQAALVADLQARGFEWDHGEDYDGSEESTFASYRLGKLNLICTHDDKFADRHRSATHVCKTLNLLQKPHRVMVFQAVLYGNQFTPEQ